MWQKHFLMLMALVGLCTSPFFAQAQKPDTTDLQAIVASFYKQGATTPVPGGKPGQAPGMAVGVVYNGQVIFESYMGLANLQPQMPVGPQTHFNIASLAKQFTAILALQLVQQGQLDLEAPLAQYLPTYYPQLAKGPQLKHLVTHRSGIRDYADLMDLQGNPWWQREGLDNDDVLAMTAKQTALNFAPNTDYLYSNTNYTLLTALIAQASNKSFTAYASQFFEAQGMPHTYFNTNYMEVAPQLARPYTNQDNGKWQEFPMMTNLHGDGFLFTTLPDQLHWEAQLQNLDQAPNSALLKASQDSVPGIHKGFYHYGINKTLFNGHAIREHAGGTGPYTAHFIRFNNTPLSIVVMSNNSQIASTRVARAVAQKLVPATPQSQQPNPNVPAAAYKEKRIKPANLAGQYLSPNGNILTIIGKGKKLMFAVGQNTPWPFTHMGGNVYGYNNKIPDRLYFENSGGMRLTIYSGQEQGVFTRLAPWQPGPNYAQSLAGNYYNEETGIRFTLSATKNGGLQFSNKDLTSTMAILHRDKFSIQDYLFRAVRNENQAVQAIMVDYDRVKNLRFKKVE